MPADKSSRQMKALVYTAFSRKVVQPNRTRQCRNVLLVMRFMVLDWGFGCFSDTEGNNTNKYMHASSFLVGKQRESQSINAKRFLTLIPIGIIDAYAFTLFRCGTTFVETAAYFNPKWRLLFIYSLSRKFRFHKTEVFFLIYTVGFPKGFGGILSRSKKPVSGSEIWRNTHVSIHQVPK